jgi:hypothetical protein
VNRVMPGRLARIRELIGSSKAKGYMRQTERIKMLKPEGVA